MRMCSRIQGSGKYGCVFCSVKSRRYDSWNESFPWRAFEPWKPVNMSGKYYNVISYGVRKEDCRIDYDEVRKLAKEHRPKLIVAGASAYPRIIDFKAFRDIADEVGAYLMVDIAHIAGLVAAGLHPNPVPYAHFVTTTTHKTLRGPRGGLILCGNEHAK